MSAANEDTDRDAIASRCSHGGEEPTAIADRSHEPVRCRWCGGHGFVLDDLWIDDTIDECPRCKGTGLEINTA